MIRLSAKLWTVVLVGLALFTLLLAGENLYSRPLLSLFVSAIHGGSLPPRMWIPANTSHSAIKVKRIRTKTARADVGIAPALTPPAIEFLGAESYLAGQDVPFWNSGLPFLFIKTESNCSLTAYTDDPAGMSIGPVQTNYQDVLHEQAALTTTGDVWPNGCVNTRLGMPSGNGIIEKTSGGIYYGAVAITYGMFGSSTAITTGIANAGGTALESSPTSITTPGTPATLTSIDVNGDGKPDLIVVSNDTDTGAATVSVFLGNGDGTYQTGTNYTTQLITGSVTVADVNKDTHPDLIVVGTPLSGLTSDPAVAVFLNNGSGMFGAAISGPALPDLSATNAVVADFNKDKNPDLATNDGHVLLGDGTGHFSLKAGSQFPAATSLTAADFNQDGNIDVATLTAATGQNYQDTVGIFLGNGDGTFTPGQRYGSIYGAGNIGVGDLDGDGNLDLVIGFTDPNGFGPASASGSYVYFMLGRGDGTFAGSVSYDAQSVGAPLGPAFAVADFNGDNLPDIATTTSASGLSLYTLTGNGDGTFSPGATKAISTAGVGDPVLVIAGPLTSSTTNDVVVGITTQSATTIGNGMGELAVFLGNGNDTFGSEMDTAIDTTAGAIVAGDFNNDKALDLVAGGVVTVDSTGSPASGAVYYLEGKNNGTFDTPVPIATPRNPVWFAAADLNGDKNLDLVVADEGAPFATNPVDGSVLVYLGKGDGTFQAPKTLNTFDFPNAVAIADVNNDGNLDIVVLSEFEGQSFGSRVWVFLGDGKGNFGSGIETPLDEYANGLQVADLNGDSLPDLALTSCCGFANTEVWSGNGDGSFNGPTELPVGVSSSFPILADLNGDKKLDLLLSTGDAIQALLNISGDGVPTPIPAGTVFPTPTATATSGRTPTATATATRTATATATASATGSHTATATATATHTATATASATTSRTPTSTVTRTPTATATSTTSSTATVTATATRTATATVSATTSPTPTATATSTASRTATATATATSTASSTATATATATRTATATASATGSRTATATATSTPSSTATVTATATRTATPTASSTGSRTATATATSTASRTATVTATATRTATATASSTMSQTPTATATSTSSSSATATATTSPTATFTTTATATVTVTATPTATTTGDTPTATQTPTATPTPIEIEQKLTIKPKSLAFGDQTVVGRTSKAKTVKIKNAGKKKTLSVNVEMESASPPVFVVKKECLKTLKPGKGCTVSVSFSPTDTTPQTGELMIYDNVVGTPQIVQLSGTGKAPTK